MLLRLIAQLRFVVFLIVLAILAPVYLLYGYISKIAWLLCGIYVIFLVGSLWRTITLGASSQKKDDQQVQKEIGRSMYLFQTIGIWVAHWLSIYDCAFYKTFSLVLNGELLTMIGFAVCFGAVLMIHLSVRELGEFFDRLMIKQNHQLVTTGIYSIIRHPIYLSYMLLFLGMAMVMQSMIGFMTMLIVCVVSFSKFIDVEEKMLEKKFQQTFLTYKNKTKKLIPFIY